MATRWARRLKPAFAIFTIVFQLWGVDSYHVSDRTGCSHTYFGPNATFVAFSENLRGEGGAAGLGQAVLPAPARVQCSDLDCVADPLKAPAAKRNAVLASALPEPPPPQAKSAPRILAVPTHDRPVVPFHLDSKK